MKKLIHAAVAALGTLIASGTAALAEVDAVTTADVNMRAGPSVEYPRVAVLRYGTPVEVYGCVRGNTWCDVEVQRYRGWVSSRYLDLFYDGPTYVPYRPRRNVPVVSFHFSYWDSYYPGYWWYDEYRYRPNPWPYWREPPRDRNDDIIYRPPRGGNDRNDDVIYRPPGDGDNGDIIYRPPGKGGRNDGNGDVVYRPRIGNDDAPIAVPGPGRNDGAIRVPGVDRNDTSVSSDGNRNDKKKNDRRKKDRNEKPNKKGGKKGGHNDAPCIWKKGKCVPME